MKIDKTAVVRLVTETTGLILFLGFCFVLVGLGIGDQPIYRQLVGFAGALILALMLQRPLASVQLGDSQNEHTSR